MTPMTNGLVASQILMKFLAIPHQGIHLAIVQHPAKLNVQGFLHTPLFWIYISLQNHIDNLTSEIFLEFSNTYIIFCTLRDGKAY